MSTKINLVANPADGATSYVLWGAGIGDLDVVFGYYRETTPDGSLMLLRDDTMKMVKCPAKGPGPGTLGSGWRYAATTGEEDE